ncbi:MAG: hypothetical protein Q4P24_16125 [Rhodobacterales bacterium]|nr:hypothetical protein [Rhodobacterales bacterium]
MSRATQILAGAGLLALALLARGWFEATPARHMLLQYPLLIAAGALIVGALAHFYAGAWNRGGVASLLTAMFAMAFWMLPRMVDASVAALPVDIAKAASLAVLVGGGLRLGWPHAHPLLQAVLKAKAVSMLGILAFLYTHAPERLCNAYLLDDQQRLGEMFLLAALVLAALWIVPLFGLSPHASRTRTET